MAIEVSRAWARTVQCAVATQQPALVRAGHGSADAVPQMPLAEVPIPSTDPADPVASLIKAIACVAKVLTKAEIAADPEAQEAMKRNI